MTRPIYAWSPTLERREVLLGGGSTLKLHRETDFSVTAPDTWTDLPFEVFGTDTTLDGFTLSGDGIEITVDFASVLNIAGCVRPRWTGAGNTSVTVASRIMQSDDGGGTWVESRCLQTVNGRAFGVSEQSTFRYAGSIRTIPGTIYKLQIRVTDTDMILSGWVGFDRPTAASMEAHKIGETDLS